MASSMQSNNSCARKTGKARIISGPAFPPVPEYSLSQYILNRLRAQPDNVCMIDAKIDRCVTSADILRESVKLANILTNRGIKLGDRICIISENRLNWLIPVCATMYVGAIVTPFNPTYKEFELKHLLGISKPCMAFVSRRSEQVLTEMARKLPWSMEIIELDDEPLGEGIITLKQLLQSQPETVDPYLYKPVDIGDNRKHPAAILCSSGTTGLPKGVTLSHRNLMIFLMDLQQPNFLNFKHYDKILLFLPFYHGYAFGLILAMMTCFSTAIVTETFAPVEFLENVQKYKVTHLALVPPIFIFLAKDPLVKKYDLSNVKLTICGAAPVPSELVGDVKRHLKGSAFINGYGMTELTFVSNTTSKPTDSLDSVGPPVAGFCAKVVNPSTGEMLGEGEVGELCFKGERVMLGYYNNKTVTEETIDKDNWLHTGDLGYYNEKDQFFITGRLKELIKYKGFQVSPVELEELLLTHPSVKDVAVVGKPDEMAGEVPIAFIVKQPNSNVTAKEIVEFVNSQVSSPKWLRGGVQFVNAIPKNPTGKILRKEVVKMVSKL